MLEKNKRQTITMKNIVDPVLEGEVQVDHVTVRNHHKKNNITDKSKIFKLKLIFKLKSLLF